MVCETVHNISLELMTLQIQSVAAETIKGVRVSCSSVAQIKVRALKVVESAENAGQGFVDVSVEGYDRDSIQVAATHFLGDQERNIKDASLRTMEGHQRQIIGGAPPHPCGAKRLVDYHPSVHAARPRSASLKPPFGRKKLQFLPGIYFRKDNMGK